MTVIAISGQPGAGSTTTSKVLAKNLGFNHFSPGRVFKDISLGIVKGKFYYPLLQEKCTAHGLILPDYSSSSATQGVIDLWKTEFGKSPEFHKIIDEIQKELAKKGNIVIDGKLSLRMLPDAKLKIWLKADSKVRAKRTANRESLNLQNSQSMLEKRETLERKEWNNIYGFDYWEQENDANLVIDTSSLETSEVVKIIISRIN